MSSQDSTDSTRVILEWQECEQCARLRAERDEALRALAEAHGVIKQLVMRMVVEELLPGSRMRTQRGQA